MHVKTQVLFSIKLKWEKEKKKLTDLSRDCKNLTETPLKPTKQKKNITNKRTTQTIFMYLQKVICMANI